MLVITLNNFLIQRIILYENYQTLLSVSLFFSDSEQQIYFDQHDVF